MCDAGQLSSLKKICLSQAKTILQLVEEKNKFDAEIAKNAESKKVEGVVPNPNIVKIESGIGIAIKSPTEDLNYKGTICTGTNDIVIGYNNSGTCVIGKTAASYGVTMPLTTIVTSADPAAKIESKDDIISALRRDYTALQVKYNMVIDQNIAQVENTNKALALLEKEKADHNATKELYKTAQTLYLENVINSAKMVETFASM